MRIGALQSYVDVTNSRRQAIREFFNGPAYLTWSRGQSMQSVGSSAAPEGGGNGLPRSWMQAQWRLQKQILAQTRGLGIIGVLPAFQGNMPPQIKQLHPGANLTVTSHQPTAHAPYAPNSMRDQCAWVASTDPLFGQVADVWMETLIADFGTDHWYQCDGFFTGTKPPWYESAAAAAATLAELPAELPAPWHSPSSSKDAGPVPADPQWIPVWKGAWGGMARTDPEVFLARACSTTSSTSTLFNHLSRTYQLQPSRPPFHTRCTPCSSCRPAANQCWQANLEPSEPAT